MKNFWRASFILSSCLLTANSIMFLLPPNSQKCLKEELRENTPVRGQVSVQKIDGQRVDYIVKDSKGHILSQREDFVSGKFSFITENYEFYEICFRSQIAPRHAGIPQEVSLSTVHGVEAKSYDGLGDAAKLKPIELELRKLEDLSSDIVNDFALMKKSEEEMRNTNESTSNRVLFFSVFSMCCLLGLATWQLLYLRRYFKAKKLIE